ncbi:heat shock 70 kDa protein-like isoform X2 [Thrips palmi]|nr:heat shock 70 kDa protein-like isoform X2 [Thrips palmi]XP_034253823.1 heat shock 70 kDa protein-like isoform X2 [Thrips palmi]XP_034253824.1 heat shock 70 kDa protein-like isoform X2 [Thrips palmi]XP_034253825.1 heat shock 70 kDa protein-like isoform X2 [Thrips palmi]XP_034253826.1 heat shock 70 kDa protein-like isoform X2 [Thrips palmi]XP_034253827.1 heat shock 70 kDa protein-like isoform X2 [Thrips palmi]XP_034253828.1 heat shock 70 kDa protein-like isoform X2 [Thrips palmi]XP_03425382
MSCIGIDLGTTNSCVAVLLHGKVEVIANEFGKRTTPSCVAFVDGEAQALVGDAALSQAARNATNTISEMKRLIGRSFSDPCVQADVQNLTCRVVNNEGQPQVLVQHRGKELSLTPEQVSSMVLKKLKSSAESFLGRPVLKAVITVPAYFSARQRDATREAGRLAGLEVLRLLPEPSAAALAYGHERADLRQDPGQGSRTVLVYDLGGGTFDVTIAAIEGTEVTVRVVDGDDHLGGHDFDVCLMKWVAQEIRSSLGVDVANEPAKVRRLLSLCERAKRDLTALTKAEVDLEPLLPDRDQILKLSRAKFENLCQDLLQKTLDCVRAALTSAELTAGDVDEVILVGGSTRMPVVTRLLADLFPGKPIRRTVNPDEAVAHGAALLAAELSGARRRETDLTAVVVQDVTPLSLGIDVNGGSFCSIIPRNTTIPAEKSKRVSTAFKNQRNVSIQVYQGERPVANRNMFLGTYTLQNLPPGPEGLGIQMSLTLDQDGVLQVKARVEGSVQWEGCSLELRDRSALEVDEHAALAARTKAADEAEAQRLEARFNLEKCLVNSKEEVADVAKFRSIEDWLSQNQSGSREEFEAKLTEAKLALRCRRNEYFENYHTSKRSKFF